MVEIDGAALLLGFVSMGLITVSPGRADAQYRHWFGWHQNSYQFATSDYSIGTYRIILMPSPPVAHLGRCATCPEYHLGRFRPEEDRS